MLAPMHIEHFTMRLERPTGDLRAGIERALRQPGASPLRWAITAVEGDTLVIEGAWLCSPSST